MQQKTIETMMQRPVTSDELDAMKDIYAESEPKPKVTRANPKVRAKNKAAKKSRKRNR